MPNTFNLLSTITVGSGGAASITFSNIPQNFTDLMLFISPRERDIADIRQPIFLTFNNNTSGYSDRISLTDATSTPTSTSNSYGAGSFVMNGYATGTTATSGTFSSLQTYISNYTGSGYKVFGTDSVIENNGATGLLSIQAQSWDNTAAISSIQLTTYTAFAQHSSASLYGIAKGSGGATVS
jgi:hypothetical protein